MDKKEILKRIDYIKLKLKKLKISLNMYESTSGDENYIALKAVERDSEEIIECATRINQEILSDFEELGSTYRESFEKLDKLNLFDSKDFLDKLANSTGFRNRLAHDYIDLNKEITISSAKGILREYPKYVLKISEYLKDK